MLNLSATLSPGHLRTDAFLQVNDMHQIMSSKMFFLLSWSIQVHSCSRRSYVSPESWEQGISHIKLPCVTYGNILSSNGKYLVCKRVNSGVVLSLPWSIELSRLWRFIISATTSRAPPFFRCLQHFSVHSMCLAFWKSLFPFTSASVLVFCHLSTGNPDLLTTAKRKQGIH